MQRMHCSPSIYHSSSCFSKWPNWPKNGYSGPQNESRQYRAFISGRQSSDRAALFCFVVVWVEQRWQELTEPLIHIDRLQEIGWRSRLFPPTHMRWMESGLLRGRAVHRLFTKCVRGGRRETELRLLGAVTGGPRQPARSQKCGALIDGKVIASRIILIIICGFQNLRLVQSYFYCASCICPHNLDELGWKHTPWANPPYTVFTFAP